jgi:hypothetical protein
MAFEQASSSPEKSGVCPCCPLTKAEFLPKEQIFKYDTVLFDQALPPPSGCIPLPLGRIRYDPMHGFARLLCLVLSFLLTTLPSAQSKQMKDTIKNMLWRHTEQSSFSLENLSPDEAKRLMRSGNFLNSLAPLWVKGHSLVLPMFLAHGVPFASVVPNVNEGVKILFDALAQILKFIYKPWPDPYDIDNVDVARQVVVAFLVANDVAINPAPHYFLNHSFEWFKQDGTLFFFLQEGVEAGNKFFRKLASLGRYGHKEYDIMKKIAFKHKLQGLPQFRPLFNIATSDGDEVYKVFWTGIPTEWAAQAIEALFFVRSQE